MGTCRPSVAVLAAVLAVNGCASHQPYPQTWPALDLSGECGQIAGEYRDEGVSGSSLHASLSLLLFEGRGSSRPDVVKLSFSAEKDLHVDVRAVGGAVSSLILTHRQFSCRNGMIVVRPGAHWVGDVSQFGFFAIGKRSVAIELHQAAGYLVVRKKTSTVAVVVVIPWRYKDEIWHRFERLPPGAALRARSQPGGLPPM